MNTLKDLVIEAYRLEQREAALSKELREVRQRHDEIDAEILSQLSGNPRPIVTDVVVALVEPKLKLVVPEWERVWKHIQRYGDFSMLYRRIAEGGYRKVLERRHNRPIPGIETEVERVVMLRPRFK